MYKTIAKTIESHTMGEPTRVIYEGIPEIPGETIRDKREYFRTHFDEYRKLLMLEPRGHRDMFGAVLTEPCNRDADMGVIFIENDGYLDMCGHGSMGVAVSLYEKLGFKKDVIKLDTPSGLVEIRLCVKDDEIRKVSLKNVDSCMIKDDQEITLSSGECVKYSISYGGNLFALVNAESISTDIEVPNLNRLTNIGMELIQKTEAELVEFYTEINPKTGPRHFKNLVVFGNRQIDRSPCGTGTSAKLAELFHNKRIGINEEIVIESIIGTCFRARVLEAHQHEDLTSVVPLIEGNAYITGYNEYVLSDNDPIKSGFLLQDPTKA